MAAGRLYYRKLWLLLGWLLVLLVVFMTLTPQPPGIDMVSLSDKSMHTLGYMLLMGWFMQLYSKRGERARIAGLLVLMGVVLEFLQGLGGVRVMELADMAANTLGVLIGWLLASTPLSNALFWFERRVLKAGQLV